MPSCWEEALSAMWIGVTGHYRLTPEDRTLEAEEQLGRVLGQLERREETLAVARQRVGREALSHRERDRARCKNKLQEYRRICTQLERLVSYRDMINAQLDALKNTELNKTLITALQESSKTLRSLGIVEGVRQAEAVVSDVEQSMSQAQELTAVLGTPVHMGDDDSLEAELQELLAAEAAEAAPPQPAPITIRGRAAHRVSPVREEEELLEAMV